MNSTLQYTEAEQKRICEIASALERLQGNSDWIIVMNNYLFDEFIKEQTTSIVNPMDNVQAEANRKAILSIQNVNWLKEVLYGLIELKDSFSKTEKK
jgi:hypothetical protein